MSSFTPGTDRHEKVAARTLDDVRIQFELLADTGPMTRSIKRALRETLRFELALRPSRRRRLVIRYRLWRLRNV